MSGSGSPSARLSEADRALVLARTHARLGRTERAIEQYEVVLAQRPWQADVVDELLDLVAATGDHGRLAERCARWLAVYPDHASHDHAEYVHHRRVEALVALGGIDAAFAAYGLEAVDDADSIGRDVTGPGAIGPDEIVALVGLRNERPRLEWFLDHHRRLGVDRFLVVDNASDDGSLEYLRSRPDVVCWRTAGSYRAANCGAVWWDLLVRRHLREQWCLVLDVDECFVFPGCEQRSLRELTAQLDGLGATAYQAIMVDCYGAGPQSGLRAEPGRDPMEAFPYFDAAWYRTRVPFAGPRRNLTDYWGGVRARMFGGGQGGFLLGKVPLRKARAGELFWSGNHWIDRPAAHIAGRGVLLHTKYGAAFAGAVHQEAGRGEHAGDARVYRYLAEALAAEPDPDFFDPLHSVRYEGPDQLVRMGIMQTLPAAAREPVDAGARFRPPIPPVPGPDGLAVPADPGDPAEVAAAADVAGPGGPLPVWSVVVVATPTGTRARVEGVCAALAGGDAPSEVVVVVSGASAAAGAELRGLAGSVGVPAADPPVRVVTTGSHLTAPGAANLGLVHSRGRWVHVVGPDDAVYPDAYRRLAAAVAADPAATVVMATPGLPGGTGLASISGLELDPAVGSVQVALRRDRLERVGGFDVALGEAGTWELVQRVLGRCGRPAVVPDLLGHTEWSGTPSPESGFGTTVIQRLAAIDLAAAHRGLGTDAVQALVDRCALDAAAQIAAEAEAGRFASAFALAAEALRVPLSPPAMQAVTAVMGVLSR